MKPFIKAKKQYEVNSSSCLFRPKEPRIGESKHIAKFLGHFCVSFPGRKEDQTGHVIILELLEGKLLSRVKVCEESKRQRAEIFLLNFLAVTEAGLAICGFKTCHRLVKID